MLSCQICEDKEAKFYCEENNMNFCEDCQEESKMDCLFIGGKKFI